MIFGGELWYGMAVVIVGGLALGTVLTLGVIPVFYTILFKVRKSSSLDAASSKSATQPHVPHTIITDHI